MLLLKNTDGVNLAQNGTFKMKKKRKTVSSCQPEMLWTSLNCCFWRNVFKVGQQLDTSTLIFDLIRRGLMWFSPNLCRMTQRRLCCVLSPQSGWSSCEVNENVCQSTSSAATAADKTHVCFAEDHHSCMCFVFFFTDQRCAFIFLSSGALQHNWTWPTFYIYLEKKNKSNRRCRKSSVSSCQCCRASKFLI